MYTFYVSPELDEELALQILSRYGITMGELQILLSFSHNLDREHMAALVDKMSDRQLISLINKFLSFAADHPDAVPAKDVEGAKKAVHLLFQGRRNEAFSYL